MDLVTLASFSFLLTLKHTICDLAVQRLFPSNKTIYFSKDAHIHYFHHGIGTFLAGLMFNVPFAFVIGIIDYILHWHIDYTKSIIRHKYSWTITDDEYWVLQTFDQALHFATYYLFLVMAITLL